MDRGVFEAAESGQLNGVLRVFPAAELDTLVTPHMDTILHVAIRSGNMKFAEEAIDQCQKLLSTTNSGGEMPLHVAAKSGSAEMVRLLLVAGAQVDVEDAVAMRRALVGDTGNTALHVAVGKGFAAVAEVLLEADVDWQLGALNKAGESPLFLAVERGFLDISRFIIQKCDYSAIPTLFDGPNGINALHAAVIQTHSEIIKLLLEKEKESLQNGLVQKQDDTLKWTPMHFAAHLGHVEATSLFLSYHPQCLLIEDEHGMLPLHVAAREGHASVMSEIIQCSPHVCDAVDHNGRTALHVAVLHERFKVIHYVLEKPRLGLLLNATDAEGNTALHLAMASGQRWMIKGLMDDARVDQNATNLQSLKPIDILQSNTKIKEHIKCRLLFRRVEKESIKSWVEKLGRRNSQGSPSNEEASKIARLKKISSTHLLAAVLIATVTFSAAFTIPGGLEAQNGKALMYERAYFVVFVVANSIAFFCATTAVLFNLFIPGLDHNRYHVLLGYFTNAAMYTYVSLIWMVISFTCAVRLVLPDNSPLAVFPLLLGAVFIFIFTIGVSIV